MLHLIIEGNQTLGEEYCEIIPINNATKTPSTKLVYIHLYIYI